MREKTPTYIFFELFHGFYPLRQVKEHYYKFKEQIHWDLADFFAELSDHKQNYAERIEWVFDLLLESGTNVSRIVAVCHCHESVDMFKKLHAWCLEKDIPESEITPTYANSVEVLEWWKNTFQLDSYEHNFEDYIPTNPQALQWWFDSPYKVIITPKALGRYNVCDIERVKIFHAHVKLPIDRIERAVCNFYSKKPHTVQDLAWFYQEYSDYFPEILSSKRDGYTVVDVLSRHCNWQFIDFFVKHDIPFEYTSFAIDELRDMKCANFWSQSGLELKHTTQGFNDVLFTAGGLALGQWWLDNGLSTEECYEVDALSCALKVEAIQFMLDNGIEIKYTTEAMYLNDNYDALEHYEFVEKKRKAAMWWLNSGLELKYDHKFLETCLQCGLTDVLDVMLEREMYFPADEVKFVDIVGYEVEEMIKSLRWWVGHGFKVADKEEFLQNAYGEVAEKLHVILKELTEPSPESEPDGYSMELAALQESDE